MANYDLTYEGSRVQGILDTGNSLKDAGYIFRGEATPSTVPGTPTERVAYIGGPGTYTNFGGSITVGAGCICVFKYTGSAWSNQVINIGLVYAGVATPSTSPVTGKVFYLAVQAGTYTNFGNAVVTAGLNVIKYNGSAWSVDQVIAIDAEPTQGSANLVKSGGVLNSIIQNGPAFDLSAYNAQGGVLATYADLSAALTALNALPADFKKGGMSMKYVQTSDNKYVQARCTANEFTTDITKWQNVDDKISELVTVLRVELNKWHADPYGTEFHYIARVIVDPSLAEDKEFITKINSPKKDFNEVKIYNQNWEELASYDISSFSQCILPSGTYFIEFISDTEDNYDTDFELELHDPNTYYGELKSGIIGIRNNVYSVSTEKYVFALIDSDKKLLFGIRRDSGKIDIGAGIPLQSQEYVDAELEEKVTKNLSVIELKDKFAIIDSDKNLLFEIKKDGSVNWSSGIPTPIKEKIDEVEKSAKANYNTWMGKSIAWFGTSIPNGGGINSYPSKCGRLLGAEVYNEAVGSSSANGSVDAANGSNTRDYEGFGKRMGHSIKQKLSIFNACYTVNDSNKTASRNGATITWSCVDKNGVPNGKTITITGVPAISNYNDAIKQRYYLLSYSYQIKLVAKYLLDDDEVRETYLKSKFGDDDMYDRCITFANIQPSGTATLVPSWEYNDVDLFVLDHGHNDPTLILGNKADDLSIETFIGSMNTYVKLIKKFKPDATIAIVSDYDNFQNDRDLISCQKTIANNWHLPFIDLRDYLPFSTYGMKIETCGYWDKVSGEWHNQGFVWNEGAVTIDSATNNDCNRIFLNTDGTVATLKRNMNPHTDEFGNMCWDAYPHEIFIRDGLHPHTDYKERALVMYARVLASFIKNI